MKDIKYTINNIILGKTKHKIIFNNIFSCNFIMQSVSYSFYKNAKKTNKVTFEPKFIRFKF